MGGVWFVSTPKSTERDLQLQKLISVSFVMEVESLRGEGERVRWPDTSSTEEQLGNISDGHSGTKESKMLPQRTSASAQVEQKRLHHLFN